MPASLSRYRLNRIYWSGRHALTVEISTSYVDRYVQVYAGRRLAGVSQYPGQNRVVAQVEPTHCPTPIYIVLAETADRLTDFGALLPRRPFNRYRFGWAAESFPADSRWFAIFGSPAAGDDVDYDTVLAKVEYLGDSTYYFDLPAVNDCGTRTYGIQSLDDALPDGNASAAGELGIETLVYPPDVAIDEDNQRLQASIAGGVLTVGFAYDWEEQTA